ncbi:MAG: DNA polymerase I [Gemmatimonadales bacterium]|jgi:DNA polymerase-1
MPQAPAPRLILIDGYALIYRAFFAMIARPLRTSQGENTSAVWGVANFLHRLFERHAPSHVAWVHDAGTSFRTETYPDYKATREKLDDELQADFDRSVERIEDLLAAFGVCLVEVEGYEADDVIGTLAVRGADAGSQVVIISGDKDFYQLIDEHVGLLNPGRRGPAGVDEQWVDRSNAAERLGVPPDRVIDYLALVGDSSDNVPGVKGVGDKTARKLIEQYGDLDAILAHAEEVKGKRAREALLAYADTARLSRDLVTIRRDVPVDLSIDDLRVGRLDHATLERLYSELEFHSLLQKVGTPEPGTAAEPEWALVHDVGEVRAIVGAARKEEVIAVDVETTHLEPMRADVVGLSLALPDGRAWYFPFGHRLPDGELMSDTPPHNLPSLTDPALEPLADLLQDPSVPKAGHHLKYDWLVLRRAGVELAGVAYDSMLASYVLDPGRRSHALDALVLEHLSERMTPYEEMVGKGKDECSFAEVQPERAAAYCCSDARAVLRLRETFAPQLTAMAVAPLLHEIELPLVAVLVDMEERGIAVDTDRLAALSREFGEQLRALEQEIYEVAGTDFNVNSTPQLRHVLFEKLGLPVVKRTKTGPSTDADVLTELAAMGFALPQQLLEYRELSKLRSTYVDVLPQRVHPATGRIHTSFSQTGTATGRLASSEPNLQNIPVRTPRGEEIRRCFVAAAGRQLIVADYSQIELRLLAHLSEDPEFVAAFSRGGDIHRETAAIIFDVPVEEVTAEKRARAKTINFATIYGQGPYSLSRQLGISQEEAKQFIALYFERFAGVRRFLDESIAVARDRGYAETIFGRRRYIPQLQDRTYNVRAFGERVAMNSPLQGSAADLIKRAMIDLAGRLRREALQAGILLQVHDELVVEAPDAEVDRVQAIVAEEMTSAATLGVPLVVEVGVGENWFDAKV